MENKWVDVSKDHAVPISALLRDIAKILDAKELAECIEYLENQKQQKFG